MRLGTAATFGFSQRSNRRGLLRPIISIIGHITKDELRRLLSDTLTGNGFANRFLWVCARRSNLLPFGGELNTVDFSPITKQVQAAVDFARNVNQMDMDDQAKASGARSI